MSLQPFPYQWEGAKWLAARRTALLADEPRLGKAVQSILALDLLSAESALVVCRGVARGNWAEEFNRWSPRRWATLPVYGRGLLPLITDFTFTLEPKIPFAVIVNYENLAALFEHLPRDFRFDCAIVDESHYAKSPDAQRTRLVFGKGGVPAKARRVWATTGTPTPNGLASELWTHLFTFGCTKLGYWDFAKRYCIVEDTGFGTRIAGTRTGEPALMAELETMMKPKVLRRTAKDVSVQLPKMSFSTVMVPPGKVALGSTTFWKWVIPKDRTDEFNTLIEKETGIIEGVLKDKTLSTALLETLKAQAKSISTVRRYVALQKLDAACELIAHELENNAYQKCVIFAYHRDCILGAAQRLHRFYPATMYGGTSPTRLERNLKNFQNPKNRTRVFIGQISAAGTSISLNAANHIFFLEESFTPEDNAQAAMRCGGVNQPKTVFVRTFCLENSYDFRLQEIIRQKMSESAKIYDSMSAKTSEPLPDLPEDMI